MVAVMAVAMAVVMAAMAGTTEAVIIFVAEATAAGRTTAATTVCAGPDMVGDGSARCSNARLVIPAKRAAGTRREREPGPITTGRGSYDGSLVMGPGSASPRSAARDDMLCSTNEMPPSIHAVRFNPFAYCFQRWT
jgi:hypothetical protein